MPIVSERRTTCRHLPQGAPAQMQVTSGPDICVSNELKIRAETYTQFERNGGQSGSPRQLTYRRGAANFGFGAIFGLSHRGKTVRLFDNLVGNGEHTRRNGEAERLGGLEIDRQFVRVGPAPADRLGFSPLRRSRTISRRTALETGHVTNVTAMIFNLGRWRASRAGSWLGASRSVTFHCGGRCESTGSATFRRGRRR
jgi:hypothetical protein